MFCSLTNCELHVWDFFVTPQKLVQISLDLSTLLFGYQYMYVKIWYTCININIKKWWIAGSEEIWTTPYRNDTSKAKLRKKKTFWWSLESTSVYTFYLGYTCAMYARAAVAFHHLSFFFLFLYITMYMYTYMFTVCFYYCTSHFAAFFEILFNQQAHYSTYLHLQKKKTCYMCICILHLYIKKGYGLKCVSF